MEELGHPTHTVMFMRDGRGHPARNVMFLRDGRGHSRHKVMAFERRSSIGPRWNRIVYNYNKKQRTKLLFCTVYCNTGSIRNRTTVMNVPITLFRN